MNKVKKRYDNIDLLKVIAIFCVICCHLQTVNKDISNSSSIFSYINFSVFVIPSIAVPLFLMVNGFLLIKKDLDIKKHIKKIIHIIFLLIFWGLVLTISIKLLNKESLNIEDIIKTMFNTNIGSQYTCPLWFLQYLIMVYIFYPIIKFIYDNNIEIYKYLFVIVFIFTVGINSLEFIKFLLEYKFSNGFFIAEIIQFVKYFNPFNFPSYLLYFMVGTLISNYNINLKKAIILLVFSIMLLIGENILIQIFLSNNPNNVICNFYPLNAFSIVLMVV